MKQFYINDSNLNILYTIHSIPVNTTLNIGVNITVDNPVTKSIRNIIIRYKNIGHSSNFRF